MAEMPEIVRSRLARKTGESSAHPDVNLLAAFVERALLDRERAAVVAHLVDCADCRECVALAIVAKPSTPAIAKQPATLGGWFREWRWALSATAACCIVAGALLRYQPPVPVVPVTVAPPTATPEIVDMLKSQPPVAPVTAERAGRRRQIEASPASKLQAPVVLAKKKDIAQADLLTQPPPPPAPSAPTPEMAFTISRFDAPKQEAVSQVAERKPVASAPAAAPKPTPSAKSTNLFSTQAGVGGTVSAMAMQQPRLKSTASARLVKSRERNALWSINATPDMAGNSHGVVQRSLDGGESWEVVPLSERTSFRAVASFGQDVWAGGSDGTLFYSADAGAHWTEVKIGDETGKLSGDIVKIDVRGPNQVTVTTSTAEVWASRDGQRWIRE